MSMKVGAEYRLQDVGLRQWRKLAQEVHIDEARLIDRVAAMAAQLPDAIADIRVAVQRDGLDQPVVERLEARLVERANECYQALQVADRGNGLK
jgi:serine/threonine-protein kinase HipA